MMMITTGKKQGKRSLIIDTYGLLTSLVLADSLIKLSDLVMVITLNLIILK
jgi:hypothetical protein